MKNYCTKKNPLSKGQGIPGSWDKPSRRHPDAIIIDASDQYTDIYFCPNCKQKFSVHSNYYMDCLGEEMENGCSY